MRPTFLDIVADWLLRRKRDYLVDYKFTQIRRYYGRRCLDVGAGNGDFAKLVSNNDGREVSAIDIVAKSQGFPVTLFDGQSIPFADGTFDTALLMFVLHHTDGQRALLSECKRVARETIVIAEDVVENGFDRFMGAVHLGTSPWSRSSNGFRSDAAWRTFFAELQLPVLHALKVPRGAYPVYPVTRIIYVLAATHGPRSDRMGG